MSSLFSYINYIFFRDHSEIFSYINYIFFRDHSEITKTECKAMMFRFCEWNPFCLHQPTLTEYRSPYLR